MVASLMWIEDLTVLEGIPTRDINRVIFKTRE